MIGKAEYLPGKANPRFVVTSLPAQQWAAAALYEKIYCARGDMENRIKEQQLDLFADRTSTATMLDGDGDWLAGNDPLARIQVQETRLPPRRPGRALRTRWTRREHYRW